MLEIDYPKVKVETYLDKDNQEITATFNSRGFNDKAGRIVSWKFRGVIQQESEQRFYERVARNKWKLK